MQNITITMTAQQLRTLLDSVPATEGVTREIKKETAKVWAISRKTQQSTLVIDAVKIGMEWQVTAPAGLIKAV